MTKGLERAWIYGQFTMYWRFNFEEDEYSNSCEAYEQIVAETLGWA